MAAQESINKRDKGRPTFLSVPIRSGGSSPAHELVVRSALDWASKGSGRESYGGLRKSDISRVNLGSGPVVQS
jgi:hypothetical protein